MQSQGSVYRATIPAGYTNSEYALQYFFEIKLDPQQATLYPGLGADLIDRPYYIVEQDLMLMLLFNKSLGIDL
jgi:hypothetical protein